MPKQLSDEEVEQLVIPKLIEAIYPILIPVEQQDMRIQAENHAHIKEIATLAWRFFIESDSRRKQMARDAMNILEEYPRDIYTIDEWQEHTKAGHFSEYDGSGVWLKDGKRMPHPANHVFDDVFGQAPEGATHVEWFSK